MLTNDGLGVTPEEDAMRKDTRGFSRALHGPDDVQEVGVIALLLRRHTPGEALETIGR